ncbi:pyridoxal phosphate-dependent aminotransferase family protein [Flavobacterium sp. ZT3R18]|uniref:aminotransferase class I/II-fold pyridoxal phosphate-dependent enzyme n=1 Tax=Flavobacterium sp. ZT3R18 TaxID=2594429 RepID=UPI00117A3577|nr:pyridoxal phosphate-dependent aminotransferase family protein [Flavobacterium sp. ZT3R18]TRX33523.1 pyridoxal phosphate-dependent aminotransferase family protein [Flavobacterium sp. ZT3R18]
MKDFPKNLSDKLKTRKQNNALRTLPQPNNLVDFASNDYIGFSKSEVIFDETHQFLVDHNIKKNGATGSRLLSGNHSLYTETENYIAEFHQSESALLFNSGYDANVGFFSAVPQKGDLILYDELCHASIRDGIQLTNAKAFKFKHNDFEDLEKKVINFNGNFNGNFNSNFNSNDNSKNNININGNNNAGVIYIVTESVFSMDGDCPNMGELVAVSEKYNCYLVVDEAHALGVFGEKGEGLIQYLQLQDKIFARIMTFGKGLGCHGAVVLGSNELKSYLVNFARSFIYTTGLSPHSVATVLTGYYHLEKDKKALELLRENIVFFNQVKKMLYVSPLFIRSKSAIQSAIIPGNEKVKNIASSLQQKGFDVKAILSPTVPEGQERLRFCIHSFNSKEEISSLIACFSSLL